MRSFDELNPFDEAPEQLANTGQTCENDSCTTRAHFSVWGDFGVTRSRWTEVQTLCAAHYHEDSLEYYQKGVPIIG